MVALVAMGVSAPIYATSVTPSITRPGSYISLTTSPAQIPVGGVVTIQMCMNGGLVGTIASTSSGHGTSGLKVTTPGDPQGHDVSTYFYSPAAQVVLPPCEDQPLPPGCPTPPVMPGTNQAMECTPGTYDVKFGGSSPGWVQGIGPKGGESSEKGTYTVNLDYAQKNLASGASAFFDIPSYVPTPEFGVPVAVVTALSLLGLVALRKRYTQSTATTGVVA